MEAERMGTTVACQDRPTDLQAAAHLSSARRYPHLTGHLRLCLPLQPAENVQKISHLVYASSCWQTSACLRWQTSASLRPHFFFQGSTATNVSSRQTESAVLC